MTTVFTRSGFPLAIALAFAASPAAARDDTAANEASEVPAAVATAAAATAAKPARVVKYCAISKPAGSMLPRKLCKTEQGWAEYGYTVEELMQ
jgi:hypothetical protein